MLSDITYSDVRWFDPSKLKALRNEEKEETRRLLREGRMNFLEDGEVVTDYIARREIFRQLKYACDKQGDRIQALEFKKWEMHYYKEQLMYLKQSKKSETRKWQDRFILWSSQSNNFGQSWWKAVWVGFIFTFICYIPIALLDSNSFIHPVLANNVGGIMWNNFAKQISIYVQLLNPAHDLSKICGTDNSIIYLVDFAHRIITAYFLFQIISAFRKYVK